MEETRKAEYVRPKLNLMSTDQMNVLHNYSLEILSHTGIRVESARARNIFARSQAVTIQDDIVKIHPVLVDQSLNSAPSSVEIFNKEGEPAFFLGESQGNDTYFGLGVTNTGFQEIDNHTIVKFRRE